MSAPGAVRLLACGGRDYRGAAARQHVFETLAAIDAKVGIDVLIEGGAQGADRLARVWAELHGKPVMEFPANWSYHGKAAGPMRNAAMLKFGLPDIVVAFPGGAGTANMVAQARDAGVRVVDRA